MNHHAVVYRTDDDIPRWHPSCICGWVDRPWHGPMGEPIAWAKAEQHVENPDATE